MIRRFFRSKPAKIIGLTTTAVAVGGVASFTGFAWGGGGGKKKMKELDHTEFNSLQDSTKLSASLAKLSQFDKNDEIVTLYAMRGCPFCARVRSVLQYYGIPYEEVIVNPFTGKELAEHPYKSLPQLQFRKKDPAAPGKGIRNQRAPDAATAGKSDEDLKRGPQSFKDVPLLEDGPMLADSNVIIQKLSLPLGFATELETGNTNEKREELTTEFQRYVYISTHATYKRACEAMIHETDESYHSFPWNQLSGFMMYMIATKRTLKKALAATHLTFAPDSTPAQKADKMLTEYLRDYMGDKNDEIKEGSKQIVPSLGKYHHSLIDIEMQGILSQVHMLPHIREIIDSTEATEWLKEMENAVTKHEGKQFLLEQQNKKKK